MPIERPANHVPVRFEIMKRVGCGMGPDKTVSFLWQPLIEEIVEVAQQRWDIHDVTVIHRVGDLVPTDQIVLVAVGSSHRREAFAACEFVMDFLKTRAPFWKRESGKTGARWVRARTSDDDAARRWDSEEEAT